jgi:hypothetical protein
MCYDVDGWRTVSGRSIISLLQEMKYFLSSLIKNINSKSTWQKWAVVTEMEWARQLYLVYMRRCNVLCWWTYCSRPFIGFESQQATAGHFTVFFGGGGMLRVQFLICAAVKIFVNSGELSASVTSFVPETTVICKFRSGLKFCGDKFMI